MSRWAHDDATTRAQRAVRIWGQAPEPVRAGLARAGWDRAWANEATPEARLAAVLVFARLDALGLGVRVHRAHRAYAGGLEFEVDDLGALREGIARQSGRLTLPVRPVLGRALWHAREQTEGVALHLKHFRGWPDARVQAHLDAVGLPGPTATLRRRALARIGHAWAWRSYRQPWRLRAALLREAPQRWAWLVA